MARKGTKKDKPAKAAPPEVSQALFNTFLAEYSEKRQAVDDANSALRGSLKRAKAAGISTAEMVQCRNEQRMDPSKLQAHVKAVAQYRAWMALPVGTQAPLFDESNVETDAGLSHEEQLRLAGEKGLQAGKAGHPRDANPHEVGSVLHQAFDICWQEGRKDYQDEEAGSPRPRRRNGSVSHEAAGHA